MSTQASTPVSSEHQRSRVGYRSVESDGYHCDHPNPRHGRAAGDRGPGRPRRPLGRHRYALGGLLAALGSALSPRRPRLGLGMLALSAASTYGDLTTRFHLLRRLTRRIRSQNVVSPERSAKGAVLVLVAHY